MSKIDWLEKVMRNYCNLVSDKSINSKSIIKISENKHEKIYPYLENKVLDYSDLFMLLDSKEEEILDLWYIRKIPKTEIAKKENLSKSSLYRIRRGIANKLYTYRHMIE